MSAIAALVHPDGRPVSMKTLEGMGDALSALGDRCTSWASGPAGFLHRLMPLTPEDLLEKQPISGAEGKFVLVCDGRIDNRKELSAALQIEGEDARAMPDSAFVLRAWEKWGEETPRHLVGSYSFVVWDVLNRSLFAAASPSDARTLYYYSSPGLFALATMPRGLFALPGVKRVLDEVKLAEFLLDVVDLSRSFFEGVSLLPPGHQLWFRKGTLDVRRFWHPLPTQPVRLARDEEYVEAFHELLDRVVTDHLRSLTPVGVSLSGGLDSSAVAATAARMLASRSGPLLAFTEVPREGFDGPVPPGRYADETPLVTAIARHHSNIELTLVRAGQRPLFRGLEMAFEHLEAPFRNAFNRGWLEAVNEEAWRRGACVLLTGVGGNMTASWNGLDLFAKLLRHGRWLRAFREARALAREGGIPSTGHALVSLGVLPLLPAVASSATRRLWRALTGRGTRGWSEWSLARPEFPAEHRVEERTRGLSQVLVDRSLLDAAAARSWMLGLGSGGAYETSYRSLHGVDLRHPLYDIRIVEFCLGVPEEQFLKDGRSRWLIRRAMKGQLPLEVLGNQRRGLQAADWFETLMAARTRLRELIALFRENDLTRRALDLPRLERLVDGWPKEGWGDPRVLAEYSGCLGRAMMAGCFVLWAQDKARREGERHAP